MPRSDLSFRVTFDEITEVIRIELIDSSKSYQSYRSRNNRTGIARDDEWYFIGDSGTRWSIPENRSLYRMLGFARPLFKNRDGSDYYSDIYDNIWLTPN